MMKQSKRLKKLGQKPGKEEEKDKDCIICHWESKEMEGS